MEDVQPILKKPDADICVRDADSVLKLGETVRGREIWLGREDLVRHTFVAGSTGSGKTELLLGMCANAIAVGSGVFFVDGKGDISTFAKISALAAEFGRQEDVLLLNMSNSIASTGGQRLSSHTVDILEGIPPSAVLQILVSLMDARAKGPDSMWAGRAIAMVTAVVNAAMWIRSTGRERMRLADIRDCVKLARIIEMADEKEYPDMPTQIREGLNGYLFSIPGFNPEKGTKQNPTALDQHGYLQMQTTRMFSSIVDDFGHIFDDGTSNVDMRDVVLNRRIVVVLLPALQKSAAEIANLGRVVVTLLRNMMASAMETPVEGEWDDILEKRPTKADQPFHVVFDEASHYLDDGMALMAAQARSLNFSLTFAVQSIQSMEHANSSVASAIMANTNTHVFMSGGIDKMQSFKGYLPERNRFEAGGPPGLDEEIHLIRQELAINPINLRRRFGLPISPKQMSEAARNHIQAERALSELLAEKAEAQRLYPSFDLMPEMRKLRPGEFFLVRAGEFLKGRSLYVTPDLGRPRIELVRLVSHGVTEHDIRHHYQRDERIRSAIDALLCPSPEEGLPDLGFIRPPVPEGGPDDRYKHLIASFWAMSEEQQPLSKEELLSL